MSRVRGACFDCGWRGRWRLSWVKARAELGRHECEANVTCKCGQDECALPQPSAESIVRWQAESPEPQVEEQ